MLCPCLTKMRAPTHRTCHTEQSKSALSVGYLKISSMLCYVIKMSLLREAPSSCTALARNSGLNGIILYTSLYGVRLCEREERRGAAQYRRATVRTGVGCRAREQQDGRGREWEAAEWCVLRARRIRSIHRQTTRSRWRNTFKIEC